MILAGGLSREEILIDLKRLAKIPIYYRIRYGKKEWKGCDGKVYKKSLRPFDTHNCIFIHVPKAAGLSITYSLFGQMTGGHTPALKYRKIFGRDFYNYFKFTFVRNPFTRIASAYCYLIEGGHPAFPNDKWFRRNVLSKYDGFDSFVLDWLHPEKSDWVMPHFKPQSSFLTINGDIETDFIGKVESINSDFSKLKNRIGINADLQKRNTSNQNVYSRLYSSEDVVRRIKEVYARDFRLLDYDTSLESAF